MRYSVTVAYEGKPGNDREIQTIFDLLAGNYTTYMENADCQPQGNAAIDFSITNQNATQASLNPFLTGQGGITEASALISEGNANYPNTRVCLEDVQDDGKLTLLNLAFTNESDNMILTDYGFLVDQDFVGDGSDSYSGTSDLQPSIVTWTSTTSRNPDIIMANSSRKGVRHNMLGFDYPYGTSSGSFPLADQFPADNGFQILASLGMGGNSCFTVRRYASAPTSVDFTFPDYDIDLFTYDPSTQTFTWNVLGNSPKDSIRVSTKFSAQQEVEWNIFNVPTQTIMQLPDLPAEVQAWFNREDIIGQDTTLSVEDVLPLNGYDEVHKAISETGNAGLNVFDFDGFDSCSSTLTAPDDGSNNNTGGGDNSGSGSGGGASGSETDTTVTITGVSAASLPDSTFVPVGDTFSMLGTIMWNDANGTFITILVDSTDTSKATLVSVTTSDQRVWTSREITVVSGITIGEDLISLENVDLFDVGEGMLTLNGALPPPVGEALF